MGARISDVRKSRGMSQAQVAAAVGTTPAVISRIERGVGIPSLERVAAIADALGVHIGELFAFERAVPSKAGHEAAVTRFAALARRLSPKEVQAVLAMA